MISIIICTFNGKSRLWNCLQSIKNQSFKKSIELIIVDNASTDGTSDFCNNFFIENNFHIDWRIIREPNPGLVYARMMGLKNARFEWVLFIDDDNELAQDFISNLTEFLRKQPMNVGVIGSKGNAILQGEKPVWFDTYSHSYAVGAQPLQGSTSNKLQHVYGACSIFKKNILLDLFEGGFSPVMSGRRGIETVSGDDVEWCWLIQFSGFKVVYLNQLSFYHHIPSSRLNWSYYLKLKKGISLGAALLFPYEKLYQNRSLLYFQYVAFYYWEYFKIYLIVLKYKIIWLGKKNSGKQILSIDILEGRLESYRKFRKASFQHFYQLKKYFGT